jgi:hypothetical protein
MKIDGLTHPKTKELAYTLDIPLPHAIGLLELLWAFVAQQTPKGNVGKWSNAVIAGEAGWTDDPDIFIQALIDVRYLDAEENHRLLVHDWPEHAPNWVHAKLKKKGLAFYQTKQPPILDPISEQPKSNASDNSDPIPEASTSLAKPSQAKIGADAPESMWDVGEKAGIPRAVIGKACKSHTETAVANAIAAVVQKRPADPKAFFIGLLRENPTNGAKPEWSRIPYDDDDLVPFAVEHGFYKSDKTGAKTYRQIRAELGSLITKRLDQEGLT